MKIKLLRLTIVLVTYAGMAQENSVYISGSQTENANTIKPVTLSTEQFTGPNKVAYDALIDLVRQAQLATDLEPQNILLQQFLDQSGPFLQSHPQEILLWQLRAVAAISLENPPAGYEAGQKLLASGQADSNPKIARLLAQLKEKGWLDKASVAAIQRQADYLKSYHWLLGTWHVSGSFKLVLLMPKVKINRDERFVLTDSVIEGYEINNPKDIALIENASSRGGAMAKKLAYAMPPEALEIMRGTRPDMRGTIDDSGQIKWEMAAGNSANWTPVLSCETDKNQGSMKLLIDMTGKGSPKDAATLLFTKGGAMDMSESGNQDVPQAKKRKK